MYALQLTIRGVRLTTEDSRSTRYGVGRPTYGFQCTACALLRSNYDLLRTAYYDLLLPSNHLPLTTLYLLLTTYRLLNTTPDVRLTTAYWLLTVDC